MEIQYKILTGLVIFSGLFELVVGSLYTFDTSRQILRVRGLPCDSDLTDKYAKSFGITLLCLCAISFLMAWIATPRDILLVAAVWALYHFMVICNNVLHYNLSDIIVHGVFLLAFAVSIAFCLL
jgi:DMSO/TMAO reductase YedYZ heme-binding membrane subunit